METQTQLRLTEHGALPYYECYVECCLESLRCRVGV